MLVRRLRRENRSVELPFRCDGPGVRREMNLQVTCHPPGRFVLFSARLQSEDRRAEPQPLLSPETPRGTQTLVMCGWCDRFLVDGAWVEVEEAVARLGLFQLEELPTISHGVCPACGEMLMAA